MIKNEKEWTIVGTVRVEKPDGWSVTRGLPTFSVYGFSPREARRKAKEIITASWSGPSVVEFDLGILDEDGNHYSANEYEGVRKVGTVSDGFLPCYQCGTDTRYESRGRPCCGDCIA